jgi:hypothetical protein
MSEAVETGDGFTTSFKFIIGSGAKPIWMTDQDRRRPAALCQSLFSTLQ